MTGLEQGLADLDARCGADSAIAASVAVYTAPFSTRLADLVDQLRASENYAHAKFNAVRSCVIDAVFVGLGYHPIQAGQRQFLDIVVDFLMHDGRIKATFNNPDGRSATFDLVLLGDEHSLDGYHRARIQAARMGQDAGAYPPFDALRRAMQQNPPGDDKPADQQKPKSSGDLIYEPIKR